MYSHCWLVLAGLFGLGLSQDGVDLCPVAIGTFASEHTGEIPPFCQAIQILLTNDVSHRLNLSDSDVNGICDTTNNRICYEALQDITIACATFVRTYLCMHIVYGYLSICSLKRILTAWTLPQ